MGIGVEKSQYANVSDDKVQQHTSSYASAVRSYICYLWMFSLMQLSRAQTLMTQVMAELM